MHYLFSPIYRAVACAKAVLIAAADFKQAMLYLQTHGFTEVEAKSILTKKGS